MVQPMSPFEVTSTLKCLAAWPSSIWPLSGANKVLGRVSHIYIYYMHKVLRGQPGQRGREVNINEVSDAVNNEDLRYQ